MHMKSQCLNELCYTVILTRVEETYTYLELCNNQILNYEIIFSTADLAYSSSLQTTYST